MSKSQTENSPKLSSKHWSQKINETILSTNEIKSHSLINKIKGGSDSGQFIYFDDLGNELTECLSGKLGSNEIILEINQQKISGYTLYDVLIWLKQLLNTYQTITLRTCKAHCINSNYDLRVYLDERFHKGSIDYDLQQTIRENVYMRTVPCTTRPPRNGEINGQDYIFLTNNEFLELEKSGDLLEYGVYNGYYYGTPKPPKEPKTSFNESQYTMLPAFDQNEDNFDGIIGKKRVANGGSHTNNEVTHSPQDRLMKTNMNGKLNKYQSINYIQSSKVKNFNENGNKFHDNYQLHENLSDLTYDQDNKVNDDEYSKFYMNDLAKQTSSINTLENEENQQKEDKNLNLNSTLMKTFKSSTATATSTLKQSQSSQNIYQHETTKNDGPLNDKILKNPYFTRNPQDLNGEFIKTKLLKTQNGFGFTIIGANETHEDFLQIKHIVYDGAAFHNKVLKPGDILVYVNDTCVLGYTHQNVVELFQSIQIGEYVELTVCRGYSLSIDLNDPNIEIKPLEAICINHFDDLDNTNIYHDIYASIVKGPMGFGFTIADDFQNKRQKIKQILDRERCVHLNEDDILCEINGIPLNGLTHLQIVDLLKECPKSQETLLKLKRLKSVHSIKQQKNPQVNASTTTNEFKPINGGTGSAVPTTSLSKTSLHEQQHTNTSTHENAYEPYVPSNNTTIKTKIESPLKHKKPENTDTNTYHSVTAHQNGSQQLQDSTALLYSTVNKIQQPKNETLHEIRAKFDNLQLRSKTPGPELYKQANSNNTQQTSPLDKANNQHQAMLRSKTPTADMYYTFNSKQSKINDHNFDTIYTPFMQAQTMTPRSQTYKQEINNDIEYKYIDILVDLQRQESGFGFRIVGGEEEGSQVSVGYIVPNGSADLDTRLKINDEILMIDNENVVGASHKRVVRLMTIAGLNRKVKLWVRRRVPVSATIQQHADNQYPHTLTLFRNGNEGFGFVIISTLNRNGPAIGDSNLHPYSWIGKIVENSPADRCSRLKIGDRILAVNNINITQMNHIDIVRLIKESGNSITLTIGPPVDDPLVLNGSSNNNSPKQNIQANYETYQMQTASDIIDSKYMKQVPHIQSLTLPSKSRLIINTPSPSSSYNNEYHLIELRKQQNTGFGFSIRGGREFNIPLFVLKLADNGPACLDSRLRVGDQILEINGHDAYKMTHGEAIERIKLGGNVVSLLVKRTGLPPPSITDIIAANAATASSTVPANFQQTTQNIPFYQSDTSLVRSKSPYTNTVLHSDYAFTPQHQQQKYFNSMSTLTNR